MTRRWSGRAAARRRVAALDGVVEHDADARLIAKSRLGRPIEFRLQGPGLRRSGDNDDGVSGQVQILGHDGQAVDHEPCIDGGAESLGSTGHEGDPIMGCRAGF
jgi:hypothetical protein